jgi:hypothetical protein
MPATQTALTWSCHQCGGPIADGAGYIFISGKGIELYEEALKAWETENPGPTYGIYDLASMPERPKWLATHTDCQPDNQHYEIAVDEFRTPADVIKWTVHLMGKAWLASTAWQDLLNRVLRQL